MKIPYRYLLAIAVNFVAPWLAYFIALRLNGPICALVASAVPLAAWMLIGLRRDGRLDALSAQVLAGILLSLTTLALTSESRSRMIEEPLVSALIGGVFLFSLLWKRPISFYRARSLMARKREDGAQHIEALWNTRPAWQLQIRFMALVWGIGLIGENAVRLLVVWKWIDSPGIGLVSQSIQYVSYGMLTAWSLWYRSARLGATTAR